METAIKNSSLEERKKIGNRIRGARIMSGLTQEEFAAKYSISLSTLKNFEIARVIPRTTTISSIILALHNEGVAIDQGWVINGRSNSNNCNGPCIVNISPHIQQEIDILKSHLTSKGIHPIVATVKNNDMSPKYFIGDILIGSLSDLNLLPSISGQFLIELSEEFLPFSIIKEGKKYYAVNFIRTRLLKITDQRIASIIWHRHSI